MLPLLAKIDPATIVIDPRYVTPNEWDLKVVAEDLTTYIHLSRSVKATPLLRLVDGILFLINGAPFVKAATVVIPPLTELICLIEADQQAIEALGLRVLEPSCVIDKNPPDQGYESVEMLAFTDQLSEMKRLAVEDEITRFYNEVSSSFSAYGGNYSSISKFTWDHSNRRVHWTWRRTDQFGRHNIMFAQTVRSVNDHIANVSSWNDMAPQSLLEHIR